MSLKSVLRGIAPLAALAFAAAASGGCDRMHVSLDGEEGAKLADLDLNGAPPNEVALLGPDTVRIAQGDKLAISIEGDPEVAEQMRFTLKDGTLGILRKNGKSSGDGTVTVNVTMPAPRKLMLAGSGKIFAPALADDSARVSVAGSGSVETDNVATDSLKVDIAGSGGTAFASDGSVRANIMGSGEVRVIGRATCKVTAMGSGRLVCEPSASAGTKPKGGKPRA